MNTSTERGNEDNESQRRAAELHDDDDLFKQPDGAHLGECPICFLPMPLATKKYSFYPCCSTYICKGCIYANYISNKHDMMKAFSCPFCRTPASDEAENKKRLMKRIKANDPAALSVMGAKLFNNDYHEGDYDKAVEYLVRAAGLGDADANYILGVIYRDGNEGKGVEKDVEKGVHHLEKAAIGGHIRARHLLACIEGCNGKSGRSLKHYIINSCLGCEKSMKGVWAGFKDGKITKENLEVILRIHKAAIDETKSAERDAGEVALEGLRLKGFKI